jgi:hypothetical protein
VIAKPILLDRLIAKVVEWGVRDEKSSAPKVSRAVSL